MKLMSVDEYIATRYTQASKPTRRTVIKWLKEGEIPGKQIGRSFYVDIAAEKQQSGDQLVDWVMQHD